MWIKYDLRINSAHKKETYTLGVLDYVFCNRELLRCSLLGFGEHCLFHGRNRIPMCLCAANLNLQLQSKRCSRGELPLSGASCSYGGLSIGFWPLASAFVWAVDLDKLYS